MAEQVNTTAGLKLEKDSDELLRVWKSYGLASEDLSNVFGVLQHLFESAIDKEIGIDALLSELRSFADERSMPGFDERQDVLRQFLTPSPDYIDRRRFRGFAFGVGPILSGISGVVQLRAAFADKKSNDVIGFVPTVEFRLRAIHSDSDDEELLIFHADEPSLEKLIKLLREYQSQMMAVKEAVKDKLVIYTRPHDEEEI